MKHETRLGCLLFCASILIAGCSSQPAPVEHRAPARQAEAPAPATDTPAAPADAAASAPAAQEVERERPAIEEDPPRPAAPEPPAPDAASPSPEETVEPAAAPPPVPAAEPGPVATVVDVGGPVEVEATKPGLTRIGSHMCKICHKVQYASWAESGHALRTPPLDCEGCHGAGSEYKSKKVMEDPEAARAAGLVIPGRSFCTVCHTTGWTDDLLIRSHAHKTEDS